MSDLVAIAKVGDIPAGEGRTYPVHGRLIALFFQDGSYFATDDACPHMGASLAAGWVENGCVSCPWHAWRFSVSTGQWMDSPRSPLRVGTYEVQVQGEEILVRVPEASSD